MLFASRNAGPKNDIHKAGADANVPKKKKKKDTIEDNRLASP